MHCTRQSLMGSSGRIWRLDYEWAHPWGPSLFIHWSLVLPNFPQSPASCLGTRPSCGLLASTAQPF